MSSLTEVVFTIQGNKFMSKKLRIVCANVHNDTGEVEIIVEHDADSFFDDTILSSFWITKEKIFEKGCKYKRSDV